MKRALEYLIPMVVAMVVYAVAGIIDFIIFSWEEGILYTVIPAIIVSIVAYTVIDKLSRKYDLVNWLCYVVCYLVPLAINIVMYHVYFGWLFTLINLMASVLVIVIGIIKLIEEGLH